MASFEVKDGLSDRAGSGANGCCGDIFPVQLQN
jgi:hypothetical protein